ncbi:MAG: hypothetical protein OIF47_05355 [Marinibacterium sp.]|nr:hypothetical protein [Marinibacterium sp.]
MAAVMIGCLALGACRGGLGGPDPVSFDGRTFRASASAVDKRASRALFDVRVRDAAASIDGAREAGRYEGIKYCIHNFGTSDIIWTRGPDDEASKLVVQDGTLTFQGRCTP